MSVSETGYQGWKNYPTWATNLWMENEESSYRYWLEVAKEVYEDAEADEVFTKEERAKLDLADRMKEEFEEAMPELQGLWGDLLGFAFEQINWQELAGSWLEQVKDE